MTLLRTPLFAAAVLATTTLCAGILGACGSDAPTNDTIDAGDAADETPNAPDASRPLDAADATGASSAGDGSVIEAGADSGEDSSDGADLDAPLPICQNDLSQQGTGDFHISLTLTTTQTGFVELANQRATCNHSLMWDLHLNDGRVGIETDDGTNYTSLVSASSSTNDGAPHVVKIGRVSGSISIVIDGTVTAFGTSVSNFGKLAPMQIGGGVCDGIGGVIAFSGGKGSIEDFCVAYP